MVVGACRDPSVGLAVDIRRLQRAHLLPAALVCHYRGMAGASQYAWFIANVWPDEKGHPAAMIFEWDRGAGKLGAHVRTAHFDSARGFREVMESLGYEVVEGQLAESVTAEGVRIALRQELVPVYVPAAQPAYA
jgi:hypothetical protein